MSPRAATTLTATTQFPAGLYRLETQPTMLRARGIDPAAFVCFYILVLFIVPSALVFLPLGGAGGPANLLALGAIAWWLCARVLPGGMAWGFSPIRWVTLIFGAAMMAGYTSGALRVLSGIEARRADRFLIALIGLVGVALLTADGVTNRARLDKVVRWLVNATAGVATVGIVQFFTGLDPAKLVRIPGFSVVIDPADGFAFIMERAGFRRVAGTAAHAIEFGAVMAIVLPIAVHLAFTAPPDKKLRRWVAVSVIGVAIPMSLSRSAILGIVCGGTVMWAGWSWPRKKKAMIALLGYAVAVRLLVNGLLGTLKSMFINMFSDPSYLGRTQDYVLVGDLVSRYPFFGIGFGTFAPEVYFILDNQYLMTLLETGIVGLTALIALLLVGVFTARSVYRQSRLAGLGDLGDLGRALAASFVVVMVSFITFDALSFRMVAGVLFLLLGITGAAWRIARVESEAASRPDAMEPA